MSDKTQDVEELEKLSQLLSEMTPVIFKNWLSCANEEKLSIIKRTGIFAPVQHQLTLLSHEIEREIDELHHRHTLIAAEILETNAEEITYEQLSKQLDKIQNLKERGEFNDLLINRSLIIAWNGERTDLIEKFTSLKDAVHRILYEYIGLPRSTNHLPTGLYSLIEQHYGAVFGNPADLTDDQALKDDEPGIEALTRFGLWSPPDYYSAGLLAEFDLNKWESLKTDEESFHNYETEMYQQLDIHLNELKLNNVSDFKNAHIYNLEMLKEYLKL